MLIAEVVVSDTHLITHQTMAYLLAHYSTCSGNQVEMTMNYMDYTDDRECTFSNGQKKAEWLSSYLEDQGWIPFIKMLNKLKLALVNSGFIFIV
jgi:hypothetical protein